MDGLNRAQSMIEYCILIAAVCAALIGMQIYTKRAVQGRLKVSSDSIGGQFSAAWSNRHYTKTVKSRREETVTNQGEIKSELLTPEIVYNSPYVDDFSDRRLAGVELFEE